MSIIKHPEQRVGVFIDTQNIYHSAKNIYHARANFGNILKDSLAGRRLVRARAYAVTTESGDETAFFEALAKVGIEMRLKELQVFAGGAKKSTLLPPPPSSTRSSFLLAMATSCHWCAICKTTAAARWRSFHSAVPRR